ncbi:MAG: hypothetical protein QW478_01455 [Candidatus Micrarchaeaceae archaeon]
MASPIPLSQFIPEKLVTPLGAARAFNIKGSDKSYMRLFLKYNYGTDAQPILDEPLFELIASGIIKKKKVDENRKDIYKLYVYLEPEHLDKIKAMERRARKLIVENKEALGIKSFNEEEPPDSYRGIYFIPIDKSTQQYQQSKPMMLLKLDDRSSFIAYGNDEDQYHYKQLEGRVLKFSVVFSFRDFYKSFGGISAQLFVRSCMIFDIRVNEIKHNENEKIKEIFDKNPELKNTLKEKLNKITNVKTTVQTVQETKVENSYYPQQQVHQYNPATVVSPQYYEQPQFTNEQIPPLPPNPLPPLLNQVNTPTSNRKSEGQFFNVIGNIPLKKL